MIFYSKRWSRAKLGLCETQGSHAVYQLSYANEKASVSQLRQIRIPTERKVTATSWRYFRRLDKRPVVLRRVSSVSQRSESECCKRTTNLSLETSSFLSTSPLRQAVLEHRHQVFAVKFLGISITFSMLLLFLAWHTIILSSENHSHGNKPLNTILQMR